MSKKTIHGHASRARKTKAYSTWTNIKQRTLNPNYRDFRYWGGRGITVCDRWLVFQNFYSDMGDPPSKKHSIDRINNNGNYEPGNCRWATKKQQANNVRYGYKKFSPDKDWLSVKLYEIGYSPEIIGMVVGVSRKGVFNRLKKLGVRLRTKSEAKKEALRIGYVIHKKNGRGCVRNKKFKIPEKNLGLF